jgi:hypothetical protein
MTDNVPYINGFNSHVIGGMVGLTSFLGGMSPKVQNEQSMVMTPGDAVDMGRVLMQMAVTAMIQSSADRGTDRPELRERLVAIAEQAYKDAVTALTPPPVPQQSAPSKKKR